MEFVYLPVFVKKIKTLSKKYPSLKKDFANLLDLLQKYPQSGTALGKDCFKIRLAIKSKNSGKRGGARIITCLRIQQDKLYFLTIYDKADQSDITDKDLAVLISSIEVSPDRKK